MRGEEHAEICRHPGEDQGFGAQVLEQHVEGGELETRMLRLEDEIVLPPGLEEPGNLTPRRAPAMLENLVEVGAPAAEVIVDVHGGHAGFARAAFQAGD